MTTSTHSGFSYLEQSKTGRSDWWLWLGGFWITIIIWGLGQLILSFPMMIVGAIEAPELIEELLASAQQNAEDKPTGLSSGQIVLGFLAAGMVSFFIALAADGKTRKTAGTIGGVLLALAFIGLVYIFPSLNDPESNKVLNKIIALSPIAYGAMLLTFPVALIGLFIAQKAVHRRSFTSLHTAFTKFRWKRVLIAFFVIWGVLGTFAAIFSLLGNNPLKFVFDPSRFWIYAVVSLLLLPLQSATEEILFRGYLNQGLMHFIKNKWVVFTLTSLAFMAMHLSNPEALAGAESGQLPIVMSGYFFFGFAACLLILIDDGLESAIGMHAGNNTFAAIFVNYENSVLPTPSIFEVKPHMTFDSISTILVLSIVVGIIYFIHRDKNAPN